MNPSPASPPAANNRLMSLDALRGFDMFWIIGAGALVHALDQMSSNVITRFLSTQLGHVSWEGFHFEDLIFPLFVFIAGVSMVFSTSRTIAQHGTSGAIGRLARRCALLVLVGIFYYGGLSNPVSNMRFLGVLQRIGLACFFGGAIYIVLIRHPRLLAASCAGLLIGYWALMTFVPFPDLHLDKESLAKLTAQVGSTDPAKILETATGRVHGVYGAGYNLANYIDYRFLPGRKNDGAYDPEGILSTIPAVASCLLGVLAGLWLRREQSSDPQKIIGLFVAGAICVLLGFAWGTQFPVIKKIWSSSFVLVAGGYSAMLLGLFYLIVDLWKWQRWCQPFVWIGTNPITIYLACSLISFHGLALRFAGGDVQKFLDSHVAQGVGALVVALVEVSLAILLVRFLHQRKIFIRL